MVHNKSSYAVIYFKYLGAWITIVAKRTFEDIKEAYRHGQRMQ